MSAMSSVMAMNTIEEADSSSHEEEKIYQL
jgi:hypothetical protein